ncbi:MAG: LysR family transcriptional regulator [Polyangiaceae bacterium]
MSFDLENIVDLALFARVVDAQSFSQAARVTGIAKSAVSRRITLLEQRVGVQLLRRSTRSVQVTADGARFYEHCARVLAAAREAEAAVSGANSAMEGLIRISAPVTFTQMFLAESIARFQIARAGVEVQLLANDQFVDPVAGEFDLVIRVTRLHDGDFVAKQIASDRLVVVGSPAYLERRGRPQRPEDLVHHECLHYSLVDAAAEWRFRGEDGKPVAITRSTFATNNGTVLREAMLAGLGLCVVPYFMVARDVACGAAEPLLEKSRRGEIGVYAVVAKSRGLPLRVRALIEHLQKSFSASDWQVRSSAA